MNSTRDKAIILSRMGMPVREIAKMTGTTPGNIYNHLARAKKRNDTAAEIKFLAEAIKILEARVS